MSAVTVVAFVAVIGATVLVKRAVRWYFRPEERRSRQPERRPPPRNR